MEEKERYKCESYNDTFSHIHDTQLDIWYVRKDLIADLLNQQDKRIKELEEENKVGDFWHSAYQGKQLEYDQVYAELRKVYEENQQLKEKLNNFETCMKKYNVEDIELLDLMLFVLSGETKYHLKEIKDKHKKELKQSQTKLAISELERLKNYFCEEDEDGDGIKTGDWTIIHDACEIAEFIDNQIKELKGE